MILLLGIALVILAGLYLQEHMKYNSLYRELLYVNTRLEEIHGSKENGFVLIPSGNQGIRELSAALNRLLEDFYLEKTDYARRKRTMDQVLTNISHDLRTPLTVLKGYSEMLRLQARNAIREEKLREMVAGIDKKVEELIAALDENFTLSKLESGDIRMNLQTVNLSLLCHEMILDYYDFLEREGFEVEIQIPEMPLPVLADSEVLKRILKNLISNVLVHGGSGKYLGVRLIPSGKNNTIFIEIEDHGDGIPEKELGRIFERNYTVGHKSAGNGLGLTIAQGLALRMNGCIEVRSIPGERTIFTLILKVADN